MSVQSGMVAVNRNASTPLAVTLVVAIVDFVKWVIQAVKVRRKKGIGHLIQSLAHIDKPCLIKYEIL